MFFKKTTPLLTEIQLQQKSLKTANRALLVSGLAFLIIFPLNWDKLRLLFSKSEISIALNERFHMLNNEHCRPHFDLPVTLRNENLNDLKLSKLELEFKGLSRPPIKLRADSTIRWTGGNATTDSLQSTKIRAGETWSGTAMFNEIDEPGYRQLAGDVHYAIQNSFFEQQKEKSIDLVKGKNNPDGFSVVSQRSSEESHLI